MTPADILEVVRDLAGIRDRRELLDKVLGCVKKRIRADYYFVNLRHGRNAPTFDVHTDGDVAYDNHVLGYNVPVAGTRPRAEIIYEADIAPYPKHVELWRRYQVRTALRIVLAVEGAVIGTLSCWSRDPRGFDRLPLDVAAELGMAITVVLDSCLAYEHLASLRDEALDRNGSLREALESDDSAEDGMVGRGAVLSGVRSQIEVVSPTDATILITGESGTGKDVTARAIHAASRRRDKPLVTVNCAAIPATLAESELFGHEEGAFTGAGKSRAGRFEQANGGTIFLDEVGELSLEVQAKLLRVIQEREVERVGGGEPIKIDVRILAATNRDLRELIQADRFREDLYYRLAVFPLHIPPLRARLEDLPELVEYFVRRAAERFHVPPRRVTPETIRRLADHDWPGNIRELQHAIERAMIVSPGDVLAVDTVVPRRIAPISVGGESDSVRRQYLAALDAAEWVIEGEDGAASQLGLHPNTLRHRLKRMGITRPSR